MIAPLGEHVDEQRATGGEETNTFVNPGQRPLEIVSPGESVLDGTPPIVLTEVERWVSEDAVNGPIFDAGEQIETVCPVKKAEVRRELGREVPHTWRAGGGGTPSALSGRLPGFALSLTITPETSMMVFLLTSDR